MFCSGVLGWCRFWRAGGGLPWRAACSVSSRGSRGQMRVATSRSRRSIPGWVPPPDGGGAAAGGEEVVIAADGHGGPDSHAGICLRQLLSSPIFAVHNKD